MEGQQHFYIQAPSNLGGGNTVRAQAILANKYGYKTTQRRLRQPLYVSGLGNGVKKAEWEVNLPVAINTKEGGTAVHRIIVPCLENDPNDPQDNSADLPIIQGGESLTYHKDVLEMDGPDGKQGYLSRTRRLPDSVVTGISHNPVGESSLRTPNDANWSI